MELITDALKVIISSGQHPRLRGYISGLRGDISDLRGDISSDLRGDISGLRGDISGLRGDISSYLRGYISDLRGDISSDLRGYISSDLRGDISSDLRGDISGDLWGDISGLRGDISGLRGAILKNATVAVSMGTQDCYSRILQGVNGVAYVTSGCWSGTLAQTIKHWRNHKEDRSATLCMIPAYEAMAAHLGLKPE